MLSNPVRPGNVIRCRHGWGVAFGLALTALPALGVASSSAADLRDVLNTLTNKDIVRVHATYEYEPVIGRFIDAMGDSIRVKPTALPIVAVHRADVNQLDTSTERSHGTWLGLAGGVLAGGLISAAIWKANENSSEPGALVVVIVFPICVAVGGMVGSGIVDYHWQTRWQRS